jgi:hypothetical protein
MRRLAVLTSAIGLGLSAGGAAWSGADSTAASAGASARAPLLGVLFPEPHRSTLSVLARFDPLTLDPVSPRVEIGEYHGAWSLSPDRRRLALGISSGVSTLSPPRPIRARVGIIIVDLETMKIVEEVVTGGFADALAWLTPRRLVASAGGGGVLVDPETGKIVRRRLGLRRPFASVRSVNRVVMLSLGPRRQAESQRRRGDASVHLSVIGARGHRRTVALDRIRLATRAEGRWDQPGLAVDSATERAYVVAADAPVAEVDLRTMRTSYHRLDLPHGSRDPRGRPQGLVLRSRTATWLGQGRLLVSGRDRFARPGRSELLVPAGATLVSTATWQARTIDTNARGTRFTARRLLAHGRTGLRGYTLDGRQTFHLLKSRPIRDVQVAAGLAYVHTPSAVRVVDVERGKLVGNIVPPRDLIDVIRPGPETT